jgi:hypothetical protein
VKQPTGRRRYRTFVLVHGAGDSSWHWHLVGPELRRHFPANYKRKVAAVRLGITPDKSVGPFHCVQPPEGTRRPACGLFASSLGLGGESMGADQGKQLLRRRIA